MAATTPHEVEELYREFSRYRCKLSAVTMSADDDSETRKKLNRKRLRALDEADAMAATAYCADRRSLKHFLPRMLELGSRPEGGALLGQVRVLLEASGWEAWPEEERAVLEPFRAPFGLG